MSIDARVAEAIAATWRDQLGWQGRLRPVDGSGAEPAPRESAQIWLEHPVLGVLITLDAAREVRRFLADFFRWTRVAWRVMPQWILGTTMTNRLALSVAGRRAFVADPPVPGGTRRLVIPRARRVRIFDFAAERVRCVALPGAPDHGGLPAELAVREGASGPFPPILARGEAGDWYEEPLIRGYTLARTPPWLRASRRELEALQALERWSANGREERRAEDYARSLSVGVDPRVARRLVAAAQTLGVVSLVPSHGDCQPGNAMLDTRTGRVLWIDWECSAVRSEHYDRLTLGLRARSPAGLQRRVARVLRGETDHAALSALPPGDVIRRGVVAVWLLEELRWRLERSVGDAPEPAIEILARASEAV